MRNSKLRLFVKIVAFVLIFQVVSGAFSYMLFPNLSYTKYAIHEFYESEEDIDLAFLGSSLTYRSFNTKTIDDGLGINSFNLGSSSQIPVDSYYLLKEFLKTNAPKTVIYEVNVIGYNEFDSSIDPTSGYILYDYFKPSINKMEYLFNRFSADDFLEAIWPFYRHRSSLFDFASIQTNINTKQNPAFKNYDYELLDYGSEYYAGKGFVFSHAATTPKEVGKLEPYAWSNNKISKSSVKYFNKIVELCKQNNIELIIISPPIPIGSVLYYDNYQQQHDFFKQLSANNNVVYYDFNLVKPDKFKREDNYYYDFGHLNGIGATKYSEVLCDFLKVHSKNPLDAQKWFFDSTVELSENTNYVTNTWLEYPQVENDKIKLIADSRAGKNVTVEYSFWYKNGTEYLLLQDYSPQNVLQTDLLANQNYSFMVYARNAASPTGCTRFGFPSD
ncbi:MAG: hypothetical protein RR504_06450 [Christensenellaceae bacterium]